MKRTLLAFVMTALLTSLCAVPALSESVLQGIQSDPIEDMLLRDGPLFEKAVNEGDLETVKALVDRNPFLLRRKIYDDVGLIHGPNEDKYLPICVALSGGEITIFTEEEKQRYLDMIEYMARKDHALLYTKCDEPLRAARAPYHFWDTVLDRLVGIGDLEVVLRLLRPEDKVSYEGLSYAAQRKEDIETWEKLIPPLLDANANYISGYDIDDKNYASKYLLFEAACKRNNNFIVVLREELKKRNIPLVAKFFTGECSRSEAEVYLKERGISLQ